MTDSRTMLALGAYRFSIDTAAYENLERSSAWRWASVERVGARPAQQYIGPGEDTITMSGVIYPYYKGGLGQVSSMRAEAAKGEPLLMLDGTGRVWGLYCITEVRETQTTFFSGGQPRKIDFNISLTAYGDDVPGAIS